MKRLMRILWAAIPLLTVFACSDNPLFVEPAPRIGTASVAVSFSAAAAAQRGAIVARSKRCASSCTPAAPSIRAASIADEPQPSVARVSGPDLPGCPTG